MSTPNESTKLIPNLLALGREIRLPADLVYVVKDEETETVDEYEYIQSLKDHMPMAHEVARKYLKASVKRSKGAYDTRAVFHNYHPGDKDWCLHETRKVGVAPKLEKKVYGGICHKVKNIGSELYNSSGPAGLGEVVTP